MKILLAIDDTQASRLAIDQVANGHWPGTPSVEVLHVVEQAHIWAFSESIESAYHAASDLVRRVVAQLRAAGLPAEGFVSAGDPKRLIIDKATGAGLIVVGSHQVSALTHFFLGNTAAHTLRHAPCSVAIVRRRPDPGSPTQRILLATDGSPSSEAAVRAIAGRSWPPQTEVRILSVVEVVLPTMHALFDPGFIEMSEAKRLRAEALTHAQQAVTKAESILQPVGLKTSESVSVLLDGTKNVILQEARDWAADWIFLGSHGRHAANHILLGSTSESVAAQAHCSVEVVRSR